jgi:hypothetical protein
MGVIVSDGVLLTVPLLAYGAMAFLVFRTRSLGARIGAAALLSGIHLGLVALHTVCYVTLWSLPAPAAIRLAHRWSPLIPLLQVVWVPLLAWPLASLARRRPPPASRRIAPTPARRDALASGAPHAALRPRSEPERTARLEPGGAGPAPVAMAEALPAVEAEPVTEPPAVLASAAEVVEVSVPPAPAAAPGAESLSIAPAPTWFDELMEASTPATAPVPPSAELVDETATGDDLPAMPVAAEPVAAGDDETAIPVALEPIATGADEAAPATALYSVAAGPDQVAAVEPGAPSEDRVAIPMTVVPIAVDRHQAVTPIAAGPLVAGSDEAAIPVMPEAVADSAEDGATTSTAQPVAADADRAAISVAVEPIPADDHRIPIPMVPEPDSDGPVSTQDVPEDGLPPAVAMALVLEAAAPDSPPTEAAPPATEEPPLDLDRVARVFAQYGPLLSRDRVVVVDWTPGSDAAVVSVAPREVSRDRVVHLAARLARGLEAAVAAPSMLGPVRRVSFHGPEGVVVVTPLAGAVLVAAARRRGALALLEVLSQRVARLEGREEPTHGGPGVAVPASPDGPAPTDIGPAPEGPPPVAGGPTGACTVRVETPMAWVDVVASPEIEAEYVGTLAGRLLAALADATADFHTVSVDLPAHRLVIHPVHPHARPPRVAAVVGGLERPGLLRCRAERAACVLRDAS